MIQFEKVGAKWYRYRKYHEGYQIRIRIYPSLLLPFLGEQIRKALKYPSAITLEHPYWNGETWEEGKDLDDIPF